MAKNEKKIPTIKGLVDSLIDNNKTVDENVAVLVEAFDKGEFGTHNIGELQAQFGEYYAPFVRTIHLR